MTADGTVAFATTAGRDFPPLLVNPLDTTLAYQKALVGKINASGTSFDFVTLLGRDSMVYPTDISIDSGGDVYVTGWLANGNDFPVFNPALDVPPSTNYRGFVTKYAADGSRVAYSTLIAGRGIARAYGITVDDSGSAYVVGTAGPSFPITHDLDPNGPEGDIAYVLKLDPAGTHVVYSTAVVRGSDVALSRVAVDPFGNVTAAGLTTVRDLPLVHPLQRQLGGTQTQPSVDAYFAKVSSSGATLQFSSYYGGTGDELVTRVAIDPIRNRLGERTNYFGGLPARRAARILSGQRSRNGPQRDFDGLHADQSAGPALDQSRRSGQQAVLHTREGAGMPQGTRIYIADDDTPWSETVSTASGVTLRGGDVLAERFPVGVAVTIRILNPSGSGVVATITR